MRKCDLTKQENEVLKGYNAALKTMNTAAQNQIGTLTADLAKSEKKKKGRGRLAFGAVGVVILEALLLVL